MLAMICQTLTAVRLPIYLDWRSSLSYSVYDPFEHVSSKLAELYKINAGIDTLFANRIRTRLELANEEKRLVSQVIIRHVIIDYICDDYEVQLSMQDYGYGKDFFINQRRNDHPFYDQNALVNYRWHGINYTQKLGKSSLGLGMGSNDLNIFLGKLSYQLKLESLDLQVFGIYTHKDSRYTTIIYHLGADARLSFDKWHLSSGYVFDYIPEHKNLPDMDSWDLINEFGYKFNEQVRTNLSAEHKNLTDKGGTDFLYEACLDLRYNKLQSYIGLNTLSLPDEEAYTYFLDLNLMPMPDLILGMFFDYVNLTKSDDYVKIGLQTSYRMK